MTDTRLITLDGLQSLVDALLAEGYTVIGPTVALGRHRQRPDPQHRRAAPRLG